MLTKIELEIEKEDDGLLNLSTGSIMQGALMEILSPEYAEYLHENSLHPYSQYIYKDREKGCYIWRVSSLNKTAKEEIVDKLQNISEIFLKNINTNLTVRAVKKYKSVGYKELADEYMLKNEAMKKFVVKFITPATFKSQGKYVNFPYIHNVYSSLLTKWNSFSDGISLADADVQNHLINYTEMTGYKLRSTKYGLDGVKINAFMGEMCLKVKGPLTLVSIANLLFAYSEYCGIGAKTGMGMGGVEIE